MRAGLIDYRRQISSILVMLRPTAPGILSLAALDRVDVVHEEKQHQLSCCWPRIQRKKVVHMRGKRSPKAIAGAAAIGLIAAGGAFAYWTFGGGGTGGAQTATNPTSAIVVSQTSALGLAPGEQVSLAGSLTNPNNTNIKVGVLTAEITGASNSGVSLTDFSLTGNPVTVNAVVKKGTPVPWSGMKLVYANSDANQDNARNTTVSIKYTLTPFVENVVVPLGTKTVTTVNGVRTVTIKIDNIGSAPLVPGQQLSFWMGNGAPNGYACGGTTSTYCNLTAPAPTCTPVGWCNTPVGNVDATLPKVDANGVLFFQGPMTVAVQWQLINDGIIGTL